MTTSRLTPEQIEKAAEAARIAFALRPGIDWPTIVEAIAPHVQFAQAHKPTGDMTVDPEAYAEYKRMISPEVLP